MSRRRARAGLAASLTLLVVAALPLTPATGAGAAERTGTPGALAAASPPNISFYNLDDLRDAFPGGIDPLRFMPQVRRWLGTAVDGAAGGARR